MLCHSPVHISLEELVQSLLFSVTDYLRKVLDLDSASWIVLNLQVSSVLLISGNFSIKQIKHHFIVNLNITGSNGNGLIKFAGNLMINLGNCSGNDATILEIVLGPRHGESLSSTSLSVTENCTIVSLYHRRHYLLSCALVHLILTFEEWIDKLTLRYEGSYRIWTSKNRASC